MNRIWIGATAVMLSALGVAVVPVTAEAAAVDTCQGKPATIVKESGTVLGTDGDDVIIGGQATDVRAGAGNDTVCVTGGKSDGGAGVDSVEVVSCAEAPGATVIDFEKLDVRTCYNLGELDFVWTQMPSELSGAVNASDYPRSASAKVLDNPTVSLVAPESSEYGLRVDRRSERVSLGDGLEFELTGVDDIRMNAHKIRAFGDDARNYFFLSGCDVVARGGDGNDRLWASDREGDEECPGVRLFGQHGPDKLAGTERNDKLVGGPDKDNAYGDKGKDRCVAEKKSKCER